MTGVARAALNDLAMTVNKAVAKAERTLVGHNATLTEKGKYRGRLGQITSVIPSHRYGIVACLMIYRHGSMDFLNSDRASRSYRPISEMRFDWE